MSEQDKIDLFSAWLEGSLNSQQQQAFEVLCAKDKDFAQRVEQANFANMLNDSTAQVAAPVWNKEQSFNRAILPSSSKAWWQWQGFSVGAFACSAVALFLVTTGFSVQNVDGRLSMGFDNKHVSSAEIDALVAARIEDYQQANQALLAQYLESMQAQQLQNSTQVTEYLLSSSRKERREDFAELVKFINQQRRDDQVFYARQLNELEQQIQPNYLGSSLNNPVIPDTDIAINE